MSDAHIINESDVKYETMYDRVCKAQEEYHDEHDDINKQFPENGEIWIKNYGDYTITLVGESRFLDACAEYSDNEASYEIDYDFEFGFRGNFLITEYHTDNSKGE